MKAILTVLIFLVMVRFTEELTWNTKIRAYLCCQDHKQLLLWNFTLGENERVTELHWFFNEKTLVCFVSNTTGFVVADFYEGRVEWNGAAGIILKNVHLMDAGEYTLYVKLEEEKEENVQGINLTVLEPPPSQCKPIIKAEHPKGIISCFTSCERSFLSLQWIINGTKVPEAIGPYFVLHSSETSEQPSCCLRDFKCHDDYETKFCTPNNISFTEDMHSVNESCADTNHMVSTAILTTILVVMLIVLITVVIAYVILKRKRGRLCHKCHYATSDDTNLQLNKPLSVIEFHKHHYTTNDDQVIECIEPLSEETDLISFPKDHQTHVDANDVQLPEIIYPFLGTVQELNEDLRLDEPEEKIPPILDADDLQVHQQDRPVQDANQRVQIVNNISIDAAFLDRLLDLKAELQDSKREIMKLKSQLYREKHLRNKENRHKYSYEKPSVKCRYVKNGDTYTFEASE